MSVLFVALDFYAFDVIRAFCDLDTLFAPLQFASCVEGALVMLSGQT